MTTELIRHPANPIIPTVANSWRNYVTANVDIVLWQDEYRLYFRANHKDGNGKVNAAIGLMTCPRDQFDGVKWREYAGNPILRPGEAGSIDDMGPLDPSILIVDNTFLLYYTAVPQNPPTPTTLPTQPQRAWGHAAKSIAVATSRDGLAFRRWGDVPLLPAFAAAPEVLFHNGNYWMFYSVYHARGGTDIYLVHSPDPYHFDPAQSCCVLTVGDAGSWESLSVTTPRIFQDNGFWYMVYAGSALSEDTPWHFGVAASADLLHWTKFPGNPIFERGAEGTWDDCGIWYGTTMKIGDTYYLWYEGRSSGEPRALADARPGGRGKGGFSQIGLATMKAKYFFFIP